ncbi:hypothetical protein GINT2_002336 [Glugoides intestinalis]
MDKECRDSQCIHLIENKKLKEKIKELEISIKELEARQIDQEYEKGIFVETEVLARLEKENLSLRKTLEEYYKKALKEWYEETRNTLLFN